MIGIITIGFVSLQGHTGWCTLFFVTFVTLKASTIDALNPAFAISAFSKMPSEKRTLRVLKSWSPVNTKIQCAVDCKQNSKCYSFHYESNSKTCDLGTYIEYNPNAVPLPGEVYSTDNLTLWAPPELYTFNEARTKCENNGGILYTLKTKRRWQIIADFIKDKDLLRSWVGSTDDAVEGVYRWIDDGSLLDSDDIDELFAEGQPDDEGNNEDCILIYSAANALFPHLNDYKCTTSIGCLCEIYNVGD